MRFQRSILVGQPPDGDENVAEFERSSDHYAWPQQRLTVADALNEIKSSGESALVLFATHGMTGFSGNLRNFADQRASILVYAEPRHDTADLAIDCSTWVEDYFVHGLTKPDMVRRRIRDLNRYRELYPRITLHNIQSDENEIFLRPMDKVFIATPFERNLRDELEDAIDTALPKLGLVPVWGDMHHETPMSIYKKMLRDTAESALVIANVAESKKPASRHNPNVYFEAGLAASLGRPIILVRRRPAVWSELPTDLKGLGILEYDDRVNLSLQLYHGLKDSVRTP